MKLSCSLPIIFFLAASLNAYAQYTSNAGRFQVDEVRGCAPFEFTFTNLEAGECILGRPCAIGYFLNGSTQFVEINDNITTGTAQVTLNTAGNYDFIANYGGQSIDRINIIVRANNPPDFQLLACSNNDVRLQVTENIYDQYVINFGDGSAERIINNNAINVQHDYTAQGTYPVSVRGRDLNAKDNCNAEVKNFTTFESLPLIPINNLSIVNNNTINLSFNTSSGVQNRLQVAVNSNVNFQTVQNIIGDGQSRTIPITNINTEDNLYCFRLGSFDPCTNTTSFGPVICSVQLNLQIQNDNNRLSWNTITAGINNYSIRRNAGPYLSGINATSFDDGSDNITCNTPYCYQVIANYATGTSTSIERCGVSFKTFTPPAINNLSVSVETSGVEITWLAPDNLNIPAFDLGRSINNNNFQVIQSSPFTNFFETQNVIENRVCYRVSYAEECGNSSAAGIEACAITLQGEMSADNVATLNWSTYNGWTDGVLQYRLERLNENGNVMQTYNVGAATSFIDDVPDPFYQRVYYRVTAIFNGIGLPDVKSNIVTFIKEPNIYFPTAFTPNNDNLNDEFRVFGQYVSSFRMKIFNRWGELVFTSENIQQGWDGTYRGKIQPEGTYQFICELTDAEGRNFTRSGSVVLFRKP